MYLQYGSTTLQVIDLNRFERVNVYDKSGTDLLYVKVILGVSAVYAPGGIPRLPSATAISPDVSDVYTGNDITAESLESNPRGTDPAAPGYTSGPLAPILNPPQLETDVPGLSALPLSTARTGPQTDAELRWRLLSPRQQLILWAYDRQSGLPIQWLCSPRVGFAIDVENGPKPISCDIISADGDNGVGVFYQVSTCMTPCPQGSDRIVLSHRWTMSHTHDDRMFLSRVITGTIVFNTAVCDLLGMRPDWVRNQFLHPIPLGYQRSVPTITQEADGATINYTIVDTDPTIVFEPADSGATRIDIREKTELTYAVAQIAQNRRNNYRIRTGRTLLPGREYEANLGT